ncbi:MAG: prolipoprotein diacylglyceryl transferase [Bacteroidales bacterium]|nr:prolipoprotein diacylglyceryl transferase [Bacteroidales bacterium]
MNLLFVIWDVSPYIHQFSETYALRWYGILFALAFVSAYYVAYFLLQKENFPESLMNKTAIATVVGGVVGARIGHCLFYEPMYYISNPIKIFHIWEGGMASHGGAIGILIAFLLVARKGVSYKMILSRTMLVTPLGAVFFRMGNLMNSEIYGVETDLPWGFVFVNSFDVLKGVESAVPRHPTQIYEMLCYFVLFIILMVYCMRTFKKNQKLSDDFIIGIFFIGTFGTRFFIEFLKLPQVAFEQNLMLDMGQWLSIPFVIYGIFSLRKYSREKKLLN